MHINLDFTLLDSGKIGIEGDSTQRLIEFIVFLIISARLPILKPCNFRSQAVNFDLWMSLMKSVIGLDYSVGDEIVFESFLLVL